MGNDLQWKSLLVAILAVGGWVLLMQVTSFLTGWRSLASVYQSTQSDPGRRLRFQSAALRWGMGYNGWLTVGVGPAGLRISLFFPLNVGHPPLFVPWDEISSRRIKKRLFSGVELRFQRCPDIPFTIREPLAEKISAASDGLFQIPNPE